MEQKLRMILVGVGGFGTSWASIIQQDPRWILAAVIDTDEKALTTVEKSLALSSSYMFSDPFSAFKEAQADAVLIATPPDTHKQIILSALEAGFHVLSEKPLAANIEEAKELREKIPHYPRRFMVSQNYRWQREMVTLKQMIERGSIGEIGYINWEFNKSWRFGGWREELAEVLIEDMSIHHFDLMRYLTGKNCVRLYARSFNPSWSWFQGKSSATVIMEFEGGIHINYFGSWVGQGRQTDWRGSFHIAGTKGAIHRDSSGITVISEGRMYTLTETDMVQLRCEEREYALEGFRQAILKNRIPETNVEDNFQSFAIVCAAIQSCRIRQPVVMSEFLS